MVNNSGVLVDDASRVQKVRQVEFGGEYRNPTGGATYIIDLSNGQKQWLPIGTATVPIFTGPTGPGNYQIRVFHFRGSAILNWPTTGSAAVYWPGGSMMRGSVQSGATDIISVYATGATGPDANQYYAQGAPDFRRTP